MPGKISNSTISTVDRVTTRPGQRRSERVVLRILLLLSTRLSGGRRISIEAKTMVVNAHGGLLDVGVELVAGQRVILINPTTMKQESCNVLRVEGLEEGRFLVAFQFEQPAPDFWPIRFPPRDWNSVNLG